MLEHFKRPEVGIENKSTVAATLATWAVNAVGYFDVIAMVEPKRKVLRKFMLQHEAAQRRLLLSQEGLNQMKVWQKLSLWNVQRGGGAGGH